MLALFSPAGVFEFENFANGTKALMDAVVALTAAGGCTIIGRFDSAPDIRYLFKNIIFHIFILHKYEVLVGWEKIWRFIKKANIRGKRWEKTGGIGEIFTLPGENIILKKGMGQKYPILGKYTPL